MPQAHWRIITGEPWNEMTKSELLERVLGGAKLGERALALAGKSKTFDRTPYRNRLVMGRIQEPRGCVQ